MVFFCFFFKQKTAYEMRISDWSSDVCSSDLIHAYQELNLTMGSGIYGSTFFMLTGFHGAHVTLGTLMLAIIWLRCAKGRFSGEEIGRASCRERVCQYV